jgi:diguanylate cyclase (GGDEF)-like protein
MPRFLGRGCAILLAIACLSVCLRASSPPLTAVAAVRSLRHEQAAEPRNVHLHGIVTLYDPVLGVFFFQDPTGSIFLDTRLNFPVVAGSRVELWGKTAPGYTTEIVPEQIREISRGPLPKAAFVNYRAAASHENDCRFVIMEGIVRSATLQGEGPAHVFLLQLEAGTGTVEVAIANFPHFDPSQLLDTTVRVTGNLGGNFNALNQILGLQLMVSDSSQLQILRRPVVNPFRLPLTPLRNFLISDKALLGSERVLTRGVVTLYDPGEKLAIQDEDSNLLVQTRQMEPIAIGQLVEVTGFPSVINGSPALGTAQAIPAGTVSPSVAQPISFANAMSGKFGNNLVTIEADLVSETREGDLDTLTLHSGDRVFQAVFRKIIGDSDPIPVFQPGTRLRVTGICILHVRGFWEDVESFQIHLRSARDISVLALPPWWTVRHLLLIISGLLGVAIVAIVWGLWVRRRLSFQEKLVRQKIEAEAERLVTLAHLEQQRSHILELINSFEPLIKVFAAIHRHAAEMWPGACSYSHLLKDRKLVLLAGSDPSILDSVRLQTVDPTHSSEACAIAVRTCSLAHLSVTRSVWSRPLISSGGEILGTVTFEGIDADSVPFNQQALDFACNLATIAIDNRRLYEDALHRSQHDQLTGLANRALLDDRIEEALEHARTSSSRAAVLFMDLDRFKAINDTYSHKVGDLYLCEIARRFQACLRSCDTLSRVGGDEFVAVIPSLPDPDQATIVAYRLLTAMRTPVLVDGIRIQGSVSIGMAIFPEFGSNAIELKHQADSAMYEAKRSGGNKIRPRQEIPISESSTCVVSH